MGQAKVKEGQVLLTIKAKADFCADMGMLGCSLTVTSSQIGKNIDLGEKKYNTQNTYLNECDAVLYKSIPSLLSRGVRRSFSMTDIFPIIYESKNASQIPMERSNNC